MHLLRKLFRPPSANPPRTSADDDAARRRPPGVARGDGDGAPAAATHVADPLPGNAARVDANTSAEQADAGTARARIEAWLAAGRVQEAASALVDGERLHAPDAALQAKVGQAFFASGALREAESWLRRAIAGAPGCAGHLDALAAVLHQQGRVDEATSAYLQALALAPEDFDAAMGLGSCELDKRDPVAAEAWFRRAIAAGGGRAVAWAYLGAALDRQDRGVDALAAHERAAELEASTGEDVDAYLGLASALRDDGRFADALALLERNLGRKQNAQAQVLYSYMLLALGQLPRGWRHNEFRWLTAHFLARRPRYGRPAWDGQDLRGATILLHAEQGMGDTLQFARYAPMIKAQGARVVLAVPAELARVARGLRGVDEVRVLGASDSSPDIDYFIPLLSVPRVFGTDLATIPADVPYLAADPGRVAHWTARLAPDDGAFKVGLVWGGNPMNLEDRYRSVPLAALAKLGTIPGVRFYSLQKGAREHEAAAPPPGLPLVNLGPELEDFADTAAAITRMDLVISVCTSVAHLAGALGAPLWVMLHRAADWRWFVDRDDSPWYPGARLFRQVRRGQWDDVVGRVALALAERGRAPASTQTPQVDARVPPAPPAVTRPGEAPGYEAGRNAVAHARAGILEYVAGDGAAGDSVAWYGEWLQPQLDLLATLIRPSSVVMELSAGIGAHAIPLVAAAGVAGHVLAGEARPEQRAILRRNLAANCAVPVTVMRGMPGRPAAPGAASRARADGARGSEADEPAGTLDALQLARLDLLKINDPASAADVLAGAHDTLWRLRPALCVASEDTASLRALAAEVRTFGYRCWEHATPLFNRANFNRRPDDIFEGRSALMLLALPEEAALEVTNAGCIEIV